MHACSDWLVYDGVIDGAGIASNYRAESTKMRDVAYVGLVKQMKQYQIL